MTLRELALLTGVAERQIRYLIAEGFVPPPTGGRAHADYGGDHVAAIERYGAFKRTGLPPAAIKVLLTDGGSVPFPVAPGVKLLVEPAALGQQRDVAALEDRIRAVLRELFQEKPDAPHAPRRRPDR